MQSSVDELEEALETRDELLTRMAHQVRTPLSAMLMWVRLLRSSKAPDRERALVAIEESALSLSRMVDEVTDASQLVRGELCLEPASVELAPVLAEAVAALASEAEIRSIRIDVVVPEGPVVVRGDAAHLGTVVHTLLANALRLAPDGEHLELRLHRAGDEACIEVVGPSRGPLVELARRLALPVKPVRPSAAKDDRLALDLVLARDMVDLHGGALRAARSEKDERSILRMTLPASPASESAPDQNSPARTT